MQLPEQFLASLDGITGFDRDAFVAIHERGGTVTSVRVNPAKWSPENGADAEAASGNSREGARPVPVAALFESPVPWSQFGYYLSSRPSFTFDPLFHAGCYYVQEASSMFIETVFRQLLPRSQPLKVLDLCAAPGGKSTHIQALISADSLLVSNEVIKPRSIVLTDNIVKWGCANVVVTNNDPRAFERLPGFFDVMVVDAPCSGSGLFRKDAAAISEWSPANVALCSQRQQRILADALPALKEDGILIYSTCSYSEAEDEEIVDWLVGEMDMENVPLPQPLAPAIVKTLTDKSGAEGYRFYPDKIAGEGFFLAAFRKKGVTETARVKPGKPDIISAGENSIVQHWINSDNLAYIRFRDGLVAIPNALLADFTWLDNTLNVVYAGVAVGQVMKERLVPHHALAQSVLLNASVPFTDLTYEEAIRYLQRQDLSVLPETTGWQVVRYEKHNLGWINALKNRVNNYYPKEIRILKQNNNSFGNL